MPSYTGKKRGGKHTTLIDAAVLLVKQADRLREVTKISPAYIRQTKSTSQRRVKFTGINGGWKVTVRGSIAVQEIYIYTRDSEKTKLELEGVFKK